MRRCALCPCPGCGENKSADDGHHLCRQCEGYTPTEAVSERDLSGLSQPELWGLRSMTARPGEDLHRCVCGQLSSVPVVVHWKNGDRTYWYCDECALDVCALEGVEPR